MMFLQSDYDVLHNMWKFKCIALSDIYCVGGLYEENGTLWETYDREWLKMVSDVPVLICS